MRIAIVGAGGMAREHAKAFADIDGARLVGVVGRDPSRAKAFAEELRIPIVATSIPQLVADSAPDLIVIAVSELSIPQVCEDCFRHPATVLMEKPPGKDLATARAILGLAQRHERSVYVALNRRFLSSTRAVLAELSQIEGPRHILIQDQQSLAEAAAAGSAPEIVDRLMFANSIHLLDFAFIFGRGAIARIQNVAGYVHRSAAPVIAHIEFDSGDTVQYQALWNLPGPWSVAVTTADARFELRPLEKASRQRKGQRRLEEVPTDDWDERFKPGFRRQAAAVVSAALGLPSDAPTLENAVETMRLIESVYFPDRDNP